MRNRNNTCGIRNLKAGVTKRTHIFQEFAKILGRMWSLHFCGSLSWKVGVHFNELSRGKEAQFMSRLFIWLWPVTDGLGTKLHFFQSVDIYWMLSVCQAFFLVLGYEGKEDIILFFRKLPNWKVGVVIRMITLPSLTWTFLVHSACSVIIIYTSHFHAPEGPVWR